jgi:hypothetical protein
MGKVHRRPEELVEIYNYFEAGLPIIEIAQKVGLSYAITTDSIQRLKRYLKGKANTQKRLSSSYSAAVKLIRKQKVLEAKKSVETVEVQSIKGNDDNFSYLRNSFDAFEHALTTFLEIETNSRNQSLKAENKALREENERLLKQVESLRSNNWVDALQEKMLKEDNE